MELAVAISSAIAVVALALAFVALRVAAPGPTLSGKTVVIQTHKLTDDRTIRGVLHGAYADRWTLRDAVLVTPIGEQPLSGLQHVPVQSIAWVQQVEAAHSG